MKIIIFFPVRIQKFVHLNTCRLSCFIVHWISQLSAGKGYDPSGNHSDYSGFKKWLQCYYNPEMRNLVDHDGRTMWFKVIVALFAFPLIKLMLAFTMWHKIFVGVYFCRLAILCILRELSFAIRTDWFFVLEINFCDSQKLNENIFSFIEDVQWNNK